MVQITRAFVVLSIAAASLAAVLKRDVVTLEADIASISSQLTINDNAFPLMDGTLADALAIHADLTNTLQIINTATSDAQATGKFSEGDGRTILNAIEAISLDGLQETVAKKSAFVRRPLLCTLPFLCEGPSPCSYTCWLQVAISSSIPLLFLQDLENLQAATDAFDTTW
jgi:hypothetical protein